MLSYNLVSNRVFVGSVKSATNYKFLKDNNISLIVNCTTKSSKKLPNIKYIRIPVHDPGPRCKITQKDLAIMAQALPHVVEIIYNELLNGGTVLIHCHAGVQRSAIVAAAFILKYHRKKNNSMLTVKEAAEIVVNRRPVAFYRGYYVNFWPSLVYFNKFHLGRHII